MAEGEGGLLGLVGAACIDRHARKEDAEEARAIQMALLPGEAPQVPGFDLGFAWRLSAVVSGDSVDAFPLEGGRTALCIAEVAGKGLAAAKLMQELHGAVRELAPQVESAAELCTLVNRALAGHIGAARYITLFYGVLDGATRHMQYENAGHCLPLLLRGNGEIEFPASFSGVMGIFRHWIYQNQEFELRDGDSLFLLTDGVIGAENRRGEEFGYQRLIAAAHAARGHGAQRMGEEILEGVEEFAHGRLRDDASIMVLAARSVSDPAPERGPGR